MNCRPVCGSASRDDDQKATRRCGSSDGRGGRGAFGSVASLGVVLLLLSLPAGATTFTVTNTDAFGAGSLRQAILDANADAGGAPHTIEFDIAGGCAGGCTIVQSLTWPIITQTTDVNGYSQPGSAVNTLADGTNADLRIVLDANGSNNALRFDAADSRVRGIVFENFLDNAVNLLDADSSGTTIDGNFFCTTRDGTAEGAGSHGRGVLVNGADDVVIGGTTNAARNLFGGCSQDAINLRGAADRAIIQGNLIGTDAAGTSTLPMPQGVVVRAGSDALIGGTSAGARNVIAGHTIEGVRISGASSTGNLVQGNYIGVDVTGAAALPNFHGARILAGSTGNVIGGTVAGAGNVLSGNTGLAVWILGSGTSSNRVEGNLIGTDATGVASVPNGTSSPPDVAALSISTSASSNTVGGAIDEARNVISGNAGDAIQLVSGASSNTIQGNYIGLDVNGAALANGRHGVVLFDAAGTPVPDNVIRDNVISNHPLNGVAVDGVGTGTEILDNLLGTDPSGTTAMGNGFGPGGPVGAIEIQNGSDALVQGNRILYNAVGVRLQDTGLGDGTFAAGSTDNCVVFNDVGVENATGTSTTFTSNWWGTSDGPSGAGSGSGDSVSADVVFSPFTTVAPAGCPSYGAVFGTKLQDLTADGPSGDDTPLAGVTLRLWRDGGDGSFGAGGGDDTQVGSAVSDGSGDYAFPGLVPGERYFVDEDPASLSGMGLVQTYGGDDFGGGIDYYTIDAAVDLSATGRDFGNAAAVDLSVTKTASSSEVDMGSTFTYTVTVSNAGPSSATGVVVTDNLPAEVSLVSTTGCAEDPTGVPTCTLGMIPAAGSAQYTITVTADSVGAVMNQASAVALEAELSPGDELGSVAVTVSEPFILEVPTVGTVGLILLGLLLALVGSSVLWRIG